MADNNSDLNILKHSIDVYGSVHIESDSFSSLPKETFAESLKTSENKWKQENRKAIWLKIPASQPSFFEVAITQGYIMHHATPSYLMVSKWLLEDQENRLPNYTTHYIGCGGAVINKKQQLLVVQEKSGYNKGFWSLPGGRADLNERISETAEREIFEELGIKCKASDLLMFRESTKSLFGKPDIYFAFILLPVDQDAEVNMCQKELADFKWIELAQLDEFLVNGGVSPYLLQKQMFNRINKLFKSGFDFYKDRLTIDEHKIDYPFAGNNYTTYEIAVSNQSKL